MLLKCILPIEMKSEAVTSDLEGAAAIEESRRAGDGMTSASATTSSWKAAGEDLIAAALAC